jgi:hypothetical protein
MALGLVCLGQSRRRRRRGEQQQARREKDVLNGNVWPPYFGNRNFTVNCRLQSDPNLGPSMFE